MERESACSCSRTQASRASRRYMTRPRGPMRKLGGPCLRWRQTYSVWGERPRYSAASLTFRNVPRAAPAGPGAVADGTVGGVQTREVFCEWGGAVNRVRAQPGTQAMSVVRAQTDVLLPVVLLPVLGNARRLASDNWRGKCGFNEVVSHFTRCLSTLWEAARKKGSADTNPLGHHQDPEGSAVLAQPLSDAGVSEVGNALPKWRVDLICLQDCLPRLAPCPPVDRAGQRPPVITGEHLVIGTEATSGNLTPQNLHKPPQTGTSRGAPAPASTVSPRPWERRGRITSRPDPSSNRRASRTLSAKASCGRRAARAIADRNACNGRPFEER